MKLEQTPTSPSPLSSVFCLINATFVVIQSPSRVWLVVTPWTAAYQASLSFIISWSLPKFMSIASWCHLAILSSDALFSFWPQSFLASGTFPMSQQFASDDQNTEALASISVLPRIIQGSFLLRLTDLNSLLSKGLLGVFSSTTVPGHQFFGALPSLSSSSHSHTWPLGKP